MMNPVVWLVIGAFVCYIAEALGKCPGWVPGILLCIAVFLSVGVR